MQTSDTLKTAILSINDCWNKAFNSGNASAVAQLYAESATIAPAGSAQISGHVDIQHFWQGLIDNKVGDHKIACLEVSESGSLAYQRGLWSASATDAEGNKQEFSGNLTVIYQRKPDNTLKALVHIWN